MNASAPVGLGIAGIGGYAEHIADLALDAGPSVDPPVRLAATCDPALADHAARVKDLRGRGVDVLDDYQRLLDHPGVEAVWLPLPIHLHRPFTERALEAGKAVMVEKPAAGAIQDVDAMIAARDRAGLPVVLGFQDVYDATTLPLKKQILAGDFGHIRLATLHACWPRSDRYFGRSGWPGRLRVGDTWVLDSPANNALSHFIHIAQFLLGPTLEHAAAPARVEAELYRAAPIENYDTIAARVTLASGVPLVILLTHACEATCHPTLALHGESGSVVRTNGRVVVRRAGQEQVIERDGQMRRDMLQRFARLVRGIPDADTPVASLEMARQHTLLINAASEATPVWPVPDEAIAVVEGEQGRVCAIAGIEEAFEACAAEGRLLHESGRFDWTRPPGVREVDDTYTRFGGPAEHHEAKPLPARG